MEFPGAAVRSGTVVVVDPKGEVAGLLDFVDHHAPAEGVDGAGGHQDDVAGTDGEELNGVFDAVVVNGFDKGGFVNAVFQAAGDLAVVGAEDVPGLHFSEFSQFPFSGIAIVRVNLDGEVLPGVQEFDEEGQFARIAFVDAVA